MREVVGVAKFILGFALTALLSGCQNSEYGLNQIEWMPGDPSASLDIMLVLDNSCSMGDDWNTVNYGLTKIPEDVDDRYEDWMIVTVSADMDDEIAVFMTNEDTGDLGWEMVNDISVIRELGGPNEEGMGASLLHMDLLRDVETVVVFVTDEPDQSSVEDHCGGSFCPMDGDVWRDAWSLTQEPYVIGILGDQSCGEPGDGYVEVIDRFISICTTEPWSIF